MSTLEAVAVGALCVFATLAFCACFALIARGVLWLQDARQVRSQLPRPLNRQQRRARAQAQR